MTFYLANAIPNGWLLKSPTFKPLLLEGVINWLTEPDPSLDYDDHITPHKLKDNVVSLVGHASTAQKWGSLFGEWVGATHLGNIVPVQIPLNREEVNPQPKDRVIAGLFVSPYRLKEGERWTEEQILDNTHWVLVLF